MVFLSLPARWILLWNKAQNFVCGFWTSTALRECVYEMLIHYTKFHLFQLQVALPLGFRFTWTNLNNCNGQQNSNDWQTNCRKPTLEFPFFFLVDIILFDFYERTYTWETTTANLLSVHNECCFVLFQWAPEWGRAHTLHILIKCNDNPASMCDVRFWNACYIISLILHTQLQQVFPPSRRGSMVVVVCVCVTMQWVNDIWVIFKNTQRNECEHEWHFIVDDNGYRLRFHHKILFIQPYAFKVVRSVQHFTFLCE